MFTRDAPDAYRYFARGMDLEAIAAEPWYRRWPIHARRFFTAFTMKLSPARRVLFAVFDPRVRHRDAERSSAASACTTSCSFPYTAAAASRNGSTARSALALAFLGANLLILMEVADRLTLKSELEIARDIQQAMLPHGVQRVGDASSSG